MPEVLDGEFVLDLRSEEYQAMWRPSGAHYGACATVRVLHEKTVDGEIVRTVVSHFNKAAKGRVARDLLSSGDDPTTVSELVDCLQALKYRVEVARATRVDVITTEL